MTISPCSSRSAGFRQLNSAYKCSLFHSIESEPVVTGTQCISEVNPTAVSLSSHLSVGLSVLIQLLFSCADADRLTTGTKRKAKLVTREEKRMRWSREGSSGRMESPSSPLLSQAIFGPLLFGGVIPSLSADVSGCIFTSSKETEGRRWFPARDVME